MWGVPRRNPVSEFRKALDVEIDINIPDSPLCWIEIQRSAYKLLLKVRYQPQVRQQRSSCFDCIAAFFAPLTFQEEIIISTYSTCTLIYLIYLGWATVINIRITTELPSSKTWRESNQSFILWIGYVSYSAYPSVKCQRSASRALSVTLVETTERYTEILQKRT